jgi:phosphatidyl-myo-inositol dimannoside synthase
MPTTLFLARSFPPDVGGVQTLALERCKASPPDEIIVLAPAMPRYAEVDRRLPFEVHRWLYSPTWPKAARQIMMIWGTFCWTLWLCLTRRVTVIECSQALPFGLAALLCRALFGARIVVWALGSDFVRPARSLPGRLALRAVFARADRIVTISRYSKERLRDLPFAIPELDSKTVILHPPADLGRFSQAVDSARCRARHGLAGKRVLLTVARVVERKGIDTMIRALPLILREIPNAIYVVAGLGPQRAAYEQLAESLDVAHAVRFAGYVSDQSLVEYYAAADIVLLLSHSWKERGEIEGYGIVLREAGACGRAVIGSDDGGIPDVVEDGLNGLLVPPGNPARAAEAVLSLLWDDLLRQEMGAAGRERAFEPTAWHLLVPGEASL